MSKPTLYLSESIEHTFPGHYRMWWAPNRCGYTESIDRAGRYTETEAREICERAGPDNERIWSEEDVLAGLVGRVERVVAL